MMSQKKIKIAIQSSYGAFRISKDLYKELLGLSVPRARMKLAEFLEENSVEIKDPSELAEAKGYSHIIGSNKYFYVPEDEGSPREYEIVEVDTSLPWWISRSVCGDETIEYVQIKTDPLNYYLSGIPEQKVIS